MAKANKKPLHLDSPMTREHAEWMREVEQKTSRLMVEYLKASTDVRLPIDNLKPVNLNALAEIARATYIGELAERRYLREDIDWDVEQLDLWLL
jgi:hypothetical protein